MRLAAKAFAPKASTALMFDDLETGPVTIQCGDEPGHLRPEDRDHRGRRNRGSRVLVRSGPPVRLRAAGRGRRARRDGDGGRVGTGRPDQSRRKSDDLGSLPSRRLARARGDPAPDDPSRRPAPLRGESRGRGGSHGDRSRRPPSLELDPRHRARQGDRRGPRRRGGRVLGIARGEGSEWGRFSTSTTSDGEGRFRVGNLLDKPLEVDVTLDGYAPSVMKEVRPTPEGTEIEVQLEKGNRLTGVVVDELGAPLSNVAVGLDVDSRGDYVQRTETTSASGEFDFGAVASGRHLLSVFRCGSVFALEPVDVPHTNPIRLPASSGSGRRRRRSSSWSWTRTTRPSRKRSFGGRVGGLTVPMEDWASAAQACGQDFRTDARGQAPPPMASPRASSARRASIAFRSGRSRTTGRAASGRSACTWRTSTSRRKPRSASR